MNVVCRDFPKSVIFFNRCIYVMVYVLSLLIAPLLTLQFYVVTGGTCEGGQPLQTLPCHKALIAPM